MSATKSSVHAFDCDAIATFQRAALSLAAAFVLIMLTATTSRAEVSVGDRPEFIVRTVNNETIRSTDLQGRITVIDFWATWCPPCVDSIPELKEHYERYHESNGVAFLGISLDRDAGDLRDFIRDEALPWPNVMQYGRSPGSPMADMFGVTGIPHAVIMNPEGVVVWIGHPARIEEPLANAVALYPFTPEEEEAAEAEASGSAASMQLDAQQVAIRRGLTDKLELAAMYASSDQPINAWDHANDIINHPAAADHLEILSEATDLAESLEQNETFGREVTAHRLVTEGEALIAQEDFDGARVPLREVIIDYVDTKAAERAAVLLGQI